MKSTNVLLLHKLLELENLMEDFYENLAHSDIVTNNYALKNTASILALEEKKHVKVYKQLMEEAELKDDFIINEDIMGQVNYYIINLKQSINSYGIVTAGQLIAKAIDNENKQISLISHIIVLLKNETLPQSMKDALLFLLKEEQQHLSNLLPFNKM